MAVDIPSVQELPAVAGFSVASAAAGIKKNGQPDLLLVAMETPCAVGGVFTRNRVAAAPVQLGRERLAAGVAQGLIVNSGNANACTKHGRADAQKVAQAAAQLLGVPEETVFPASTGVIGEPLPVDRILAALPGLGAERQPGNWLAAARAIMTTDAYPKAGARTLSIAGQTVTVVGIAKGAGMIHPDMATLLVFLFTDAAIAPQALQHITAQAAQGSFNLISVDGDTSTNDTLLAFASGKAGHAPLSDPADPGIAVLGEAFAELCQELALMVVKDGEGATRIAEITVTGAPDVPSARQVAMTVAGSSLVKTALFGQDPNWGRILAAVGNAGVDLKVERIRIWLGESLLVEAGLRAESYTEAQGQEVMSRKVVPIRIALGLGTGEVTVRTCDLGHEYVRINADYRT